MIADVAAEEIRGRAFGVHRGADHVGAIVGPLVATALLAGGLAVRQVFWVAAVPGALAVLLAWLAVRSAARDRARADAGASSSAAPDAPVERPAPGFRPLVIVLAVAALLRAPETLLILRAQDLGVAVSAVPLLWASLHVVRTLASYPGGMLTDLWGPRRTLAAGWIVYAALAVAFAVATSAAQAWAVFLTFGLVAGLTESPERKLVAGFAGSARRGRGFGWYHGSLSAVALPGAALFGWLYQRHGADVALTASAGATVVALVLLAATAPRRPRAVP
jgi:MFS family permease